MLSTPHFQHGDHVELLDGAPTPPRFHLRAGSRGQVLFADPPRGDHGTAWITVLFGRAGRPICLHARWLRRIAL